MTTTTASDCPFKAGETYMTCDGDAAGIDREDGREPYPLLGWIDDGGGKFNACWNRKGHWLGDRNARRGRNLLPPTPTADGLAAARAEIDRLSAILTAFPEPQRYEEPEDYSKRVDDWWRANRQAIRALPSPPDAKPAPERERLQGEFWVNVYRSCVGAQTFGSENAAGVYSGSGRIACIRVDLSQHHVGEGLEP